MAQDNVKKEEVIVEGRPAHSGAVIRPTREYRLLPGNQHQHDGVALQSGDVVHLTAEQAQAFRDRFDPVDPNAEFKVHDLKTHQDSMKRIANSRAHVPQSGEALQAQADKTTAERKAGGLGLDIPRTADAAAGTLTKDPGPIASGVPATKNVASPKDVKEPSASKSGEQK